MNHALPGPASFSPRLQWQARSNLSIFIHSLHLLDLDRLPGWPNISESTLSNSKSSLNLQTRVKSTEWALYHLFRLYSPSETQSRLSSHFPPTTPVQSKNLRAQLYKWLTELKSTGILSKEIVLRKTMLDECKGEKFEEVLARFAMVVLKEQLARQGNTENAAMRSGETAAKGQSVDTVIPLILAHRVVLQQSLRTRQDLQSKAIECSQKLAQIRCDMDSSFQELQMQSGNASDGHGPLAPNELKLLREQVNLAFASDRRWARFIFEGNFSASGATSLQKLPRWPFEHDGTFFPEHIGAKSAEEDVDEPMRQLQSVISLHQARLDQLTQLRDSLVLETEKRAGTNLHGISSEVLMTTTASADKDKLVRSVPKLRFNRHQELSLKF